MKIGIISDTHGSLNDFQKALEILKNADMILHLGDVLYHGPRNALPESYNPKEIARIINKDPKFTYIRGNCDSEVDEMVIERDIHQKDRLLELDGYKFYMIHGHQKPIEELIKDAKEKGADVFLYGHYHVKKLEYSDDLLVVNPGSTSIPKDGSKSLAIYEDGEISLVELESGKVVDKKAVKNGTY